jgi:hypothetical protein
MLVIAAALSQTSEDRNRLRFGWVNSPILWLLDIKLIGSFSGNEADIRYQNDVGDCEFKWMSEYGSAWRRAGCFDVSTSFSLTILIFLIERNHRENT